MSVEPKSDVTTRAEIASLDRIRNVSIGLQNPSKPRQAIWFRCVTNIAQISFSKELVFHRTRLWPLRNSRHLTNICHVPNTGFAQSNSIDFVRLDTSQTSGKT